MNPSNLYDINNPIGIWHQRGGNSVTNTSESQAKYGSLHDYLHAVFSGTGTWDDYVSASVLFIIMGVLVALLLTALYRVFHHNY